MQNEVLDTIWMAGVICNQRSKAELIKHIKDLLTKFFGFEQAGVLLRDTKNNIYFTINELTNEEKEIWLLEQIKERGISNPTKRDEQDLEILLDQYREMRTIAFPRNTGISGKVFNDHQTYIGNSILQETKFSADIDNQT